MSKTVSQSMKIAERYVLHNWFTLYNLIILFNYITLCFVGQTICVWVLGFETSCMSRNVLKNVSLFTTLLFQHGFCSMQTNILAWVTPTIEQYSKNDTLVQIQEKYITQVG